MTTQTTGGRGRHRRPRPRKVLFAVGGLALAAGALSLVRLAPESVIGGPGSAEAEPRYTPGAGTGTDRAGTTAATVEALPREPVGHLPTGRPQRDTDPGHEHHTPADHDRTAGRSGDHRHHDHPRDPERPGDDRTPAPDHDGSCAPPAPDIRPDHTPATTPHGRPAPPGRPGPVRTDHQPVRGPARRRRRWRDRGRGQGRLKGPRRTATCPRSAASAATARPHRGRARGAATSVAGRSGRSGGPRPPSPRWRRPRPPPPRRPGPRRGG